MSSPNVYDISAVENLIFELLLTGKKDLGYENDYPTLQSGTVENIANNLSTFIYESLKQKSSASSIRRGNVLKFINILCEEKEAHLGSENYECILESFRDNFKPNDNRDLTDFIRNCKLELETVSLNNFTNTVLEFHKRKNAKQKEKLKCFENIKKYDQEKIDPRLNIQPQQYFSYYETSDNFIIELLGPNSHNTINPVNANDSTQYREKQIKLCYALINLKRSSDFYIIKCILDRLLKYGTLKKFELNFLNYLWMLEGDELSDFKLLFAKNFYFVVERYIIKFCVELLNLSDERQVCQYFVQLEDNPKLMKIQNLSRENSNFFRKTRSLIHELYVMSYCNFNILKFSDLII